ncbi:MAG: hypothetical protein JO233_04230 [Candidatus Eremiobacteraeota bacterium]|nr:hypothetical protein [Candidatus Eremiobacteraeota bacterium]
MLRQLRRPHSLELHPLARILADVLNAPSCYDAVRSVIDQAFANAGTFGAKLRELVYRSDIDGTATRASVANQMNLSARQYFRYRKEAILLLVEHINALVQRPARGEESLLVRLAEKVRLQDPGQAAHIFESLATTEDAALHFSAEAVESRIEAGEALPESALAAFSQDVSNRLTARLTVAHAQRCRRDAATALGDRLLRSHVDREQPMPAEISSELARAVLVMARHAHGAYDFELATRELRTLSQTETSLIFEAVLAEVESDLLSGHLASAQSQLAIADRLADGTSARETALVALQHSAVLLESDEFGKATTYAEAARCAFRAFSYERSLADVLAIRARFALGEPLQNIEAVGFPWRDAYLQAVKARECLVMGDADRALAAATEAAAASTSFGFSGILALALATLAHLTYAEDSLNARRQLLEAWQLFLKCSAGTLVGDLFKGTMFQNHRLDETILDDEFFNAYVQRLNDDFLALPLFATDQTRAEFALMLKACVQDALDMPQADDAALAIEKLREVLATHASSQTNIARFRERLVARAQFLLGPWIGGERGERFAASFGRRLNARLELLG